MSSDTSSLPQIATGRVFRKASVRSTGMLLAVAWALPFVVHMVPWGGGTPLGAFLMPMFWAAFVAVYFYGLSVGLLVGLFSPMLNLLATGLPMPKFQLVMSFELVVFVVFSWLVLRNAKARGFWLLAPLAYLVAKTCSTSLQAATAFFGDIGAPLAFFTRSISTGALGLVALAIINLALVKGLVGSGHGGNGPEQAA